jgi:hypothetical protein
VGSRMGLTFFSEIKSYSEVMKKREIFSLWKPGVIGSNPVTNVLRSMIWTCCQIFNILHKLFLANELHIFMKFILPQY